MFAACLRVFCARSATGCLGLVSRTERELCSKKRFPLFSIQSRIVPQICVMKKANVSTSPADDTGNATNNSTTLESSPTKTIPPTTFEDAEFTTSADDQANVAALKSAMETVRGGGTQSKSQLPPAASIVPLCEIAPGRFKYVLIQATDKQTDVTTHHVRSAFGSYHANVAGESVTLAVSGSGIHMLDSKSIGLLRSHLPSCHLLLFTN